MYTQQLLDDPKFQKANLTMKREMLKKRMSDVKSVIRERMEKGFSGGEGRTLRKAAQASSKYSKEIRREALEMMKESYGTTGSLEDMSFRELDTFMRFADYLKTIKDEVGSL